MTTQFETPTAFMLIGVPGSGKSFWTKQTLDSVNNYRIISTDDFIEKVAAEQGKTYNDVFKDEIDAATKQMILDIADAIAKKENIIWDQTNLTVKSRASKVARLISAGYMIIAVVFECPQEELERRRIDRQQKTGKFISQSILDSMSATYVRPTKEEGFHDILIISPEET
jgi:predicted kinase